jgi:hypothetical protein
MRFQTFTRTGEWAWGFIPPCFTPLEKFKARIRALRRSKMIKLTVVTHFWKDDKEYAGDYVAMEILDQNGNVIKEYQDAYHDSSGEKVRGFIAGVKWAKGSELVEVEYKSVADISALFEY